MGALKKITFTGVDDKTDLDELRKLSLDYKYFVEFGVLVSNERTREGNDQRFPSVDRIHSIRRRFVSEQLSLHLCGDLARNAMKDNWNGVYNLIGNDMLHFNRCQLNISNMQQSSVLHLEPPTSFKEVIIQQSSMSKMWQYLTAKKNNSDDNLNTRVNVSVLFDASGGRGITNEFEPYPYEWSGYAGGISADNFPSLVIPLIKNPYIRDFWVDMESSVRTDNWFDIEKVKKVLDVWDSLKNSL